MSNIKHLIIILGDQLNHDNPALTQHAHEQAQCIVVMAEVPYESTHVWSSKPRTALFLAAMRHFAHELNQAGWQVEYLPIGQHTFTTLSDVWADAIARHRPQRLVACEAGDWRVEQALHACSTQHGLPLALLDDTHFMISRANFKQWAGKGKFLRMEMFYRMMRKDHAVLMTSTGDGQTSTEPIGGQWNYDADNRESFGKQGPQDVPAPPNFAPAFTDDAITTQALADVQQHFASHPGALDDFAWPVNRAQALQAMQHFMQTRLARFGATQDAMWTGEPFLFHSLLSSSLNLKLLNPREVINAAVAQYQAGRASIQATEGFVRQILGWREFMRGVYWADMPQLAQDNHLHAQQPLPAWYWTANTHMNCMRHSIGQTLQHGYAHHIQRLMVTGNFALLAGVVPQQVCDWYLSVYVDAVDWVELPNTAGMALYANGGRFTTKPYIASGAYIKRMSNYCSGCRYKPDIKTGPQACPFTTLYWNFLDKHKPMLNANPRAALMMKNYARLSEDEVQAIRAQAAITLRDMDKL